MTLLLILLGLAVIVGVARYNESDALFWKLLVSFIGGFIACNIATHILNSDERSKDNLEQVSPTQGLPSPEQTCDALFAITEMLATTVDVEHQNSAGKVNSPVKTKVVIASSKVSAAARDQPFKFFDTS